MTDEDKGQNPDKNEEEIFADDLDEEFGEGEDDLEGEEGEKDEKPKKDDKKEDEKGDSSKKESSAIVQKKKYREQLQVARTRIKELEEMQKKGTLSEEEKKELAANEFLTKTIRNVLEGIEAERSQKEQEAEEALEEELAEVLEEHTGVTEKQVLDVCEELGISPKQAIKVIQREERLKGKEKPKMPQSKRGSGEVKDTSKEQRPKTFDEANRAAKEMI